MNLYKSKMLRDAFDLYTREQNAYLPDGEVLAAVVLSPTLQSKMERLLTRRKRGVYTLFGTVGRRVASILIAMLIALTSVTVSVTAVRESVISFFVEVFDTHTRVSLDKPDIDGVDRGPFVPCEPTYIPAGFVESRRLNDSIRLQIRYQHDSDQDISYHQQFNDNASMQLDTEGTTYREITINGMDGLAYTNKGRSLVLFWDDIYLYLFSASAALGEDELIKMAESLQ